MWGKARRLLSQSVGDRMQTQPSPAQPSKPLLGNLDQTRDGAGQTRSPASRSPVPSQGCFSVSVRTISQTARNRLQHATTRSEVCSCRCMMIRPFSPVLPCRFVFVDDSWMCVGCAVHTHPTLILLRPIVIIPKRTLGSGRVGRFPLQYMLSYHGSRYTEPCLLSAKSFKQECGVEQAREWLGLGNAPFL